MPRLEHPLRGKNIKGVLVLEDNASCGDIVNNAEEAAFYLRATWIWDSGECVLPEYPKSILNGYDLSWLTKEAKKETGYKFISHSFDEEYILFNTEKELEKLLYVFIVLWFGTYN